MKQYNQLTAAQQGQAVDATTVSLLKAILDGGLRFNDALNGDDLQVRIDAACQKAEDMQTPWFAHEYIMDTCREEIEGMARTDAEDALYPKSEEHCIANIA